MGLNPWTDQKCYSGLPVLLRGLVEHYVRRRPGSLGTPLDLAGLCREARDVLALRARILS